MISRAGKQITYGFLYLLLTVGVALGLYSLITRPNSTCSDGYKNQGEEAVDCGGPCGDCETNGLSILLGEKTHFGLTKLKKTTFYMEFKNPNEDFWVKSFDYTLNVFDASGNEISSFSGRSSIAPLGKRVAVVVAADIDPRNVSRTDLGITDVEWSPTVEYHVDGVSVSDVRARVTQGDKISVFGTVTNNVSSLARSVTVIAVFRDRESRIVNASSTVVDAVQPFSKKDFEIFLSPDQVSSIDLAKTETVIEVIR